VTISGHSASRAKAASLPGGIAQLFGRSSTRTAGLKLIGQNAFASIQHGIEGHRLTIGSAIGNDLILPHRSVSARHAVIRRALGRCYLRDLGSTNGTFLNGRRIEAEQPLHPGDELRFGAARFALAGREKSASSLATYAGAALGLVVLAAAGYLAVDFVNNWENLETLRSESAVASSSIVSNAASESAGRANPTSSVPEGPAAASPPPVWLVAINEYRAGAKLAPVVEDPKLSDADRKHAMYVVKNYEDMVGPGHLIGAEMHDEEKGNSWYTPEGAQAGAQSDVNQLWGPEKSPSPMWALNNWLDGPFHRLWILNPGLRRVGYGEFCEKRYCVAALDLGSGADPPHGAAPLPSPIEFPADGSITTRNSFSGEWPSPLTSCAGYASPAGLPATIQLGAMVDAKLGEYQITRDGHGLEACGIDAATYQNPVSAEQDRGRAILAQMGAVIIVPRYPLTPGGYLVTAAINDHKYQWTFTVAAASAEPDPYGEAPATSEAAPDVVPSASSKPSAKDEFEAALRAGYARVLKDDSTSREEYERDIAAKEAAAKNVLARAETALKAKMVEFQRRGESAFPEGPGAVASPDSDQWRNELNRDRAAVDLPQVSEDPALSDADLAHAKYLVMNYPARAEIGAEMHSEDPSKPGYTPQGMAAAGQSNIAPYWYHPSSMPPPSTSPLVFLNEWLAGPFHRASILYPGLHRVGFGQFCQDRACAAALNISESLQPVSGPGAFEHPVIFPPQKYPVALVDLQNEWPNPASACAGYASPIGLPVTIQLGTNIDAKLSSYTLSQNSHPVEACGFDAMTYVNPSPDDQQRARSILHWFGEVVIVPRKPLVRGATYEVNATVNDLPYKWSFTVSR
jgi:hypothetical protein